MKYPRLPKRIDRRCKLTEKDICCIRVLKKNGVCVSKIARRFRVSISTIHYWTNKKFRQMCNEGVRIPVAIEVKRKRQLESIAYRMSFPKWARLLKKYRSEYYKKKYRIQKLS